MRYLARLYPRTWRDRYGQEVAELLAASPHPWRDGINVAACAAVAWLEVPMIKVIVLLSAVITLVLFGFAVGQLAGGVPEIARHWWSSASAGVAACALGASISVLAEGRPILRRGRGE